MEMKLFSPTKLILPDGGDQVKDFLTYTDKSVSFQISRLQQNIHFKRSSPAQFQKMMEGLKEEQHKSLLFFDESGQPWTYSGLWKDLSDRFGWSVANPPSAESEKAIPWQNQPNEMRYYQKAAVESLLAAGHGAIELPTGSGKSLILLNLLKSNPVKTVIMTPFSNITNQLTKDLEAAFGAKYVGQYGDGKKKTDKLFTVANAQSLTRIKPGSKEWKELSTCKVFIADESHSTPSETFKAVCLSGVGANATKRFFLSATQTRTDGSELVLTGITGPIVYRKSYLELADEGYLKKIKVRIFKVAASNSTISDPKKEIRQNMYDNPNVAKMAALLARKAWELQGRQVIILIEEYSQFLALKDHMTIPYKFAHGTVTSDAKKVVPSEYWKCDIDSIVKEFNDGVLPCLIGTTAISTGVDLRPTGAIVYLQGGKSEIKVKQGVGRGTRPVAHKELWICDFKVVGSRLLENQIEARKSIYETLTRESIDEIG